MNIKKLRLADVVDKTDTSKDTSREDVKSPVDDGDSVVDNSVVSVTEISDVEMDVSSDVDIIKECAGNDIDKFIDDISDEDKARYVTILKTAGEGELRDRLFMEFGVCGGIDEVLLALKKVLKEDANLDVSYMRFGSSYDERSVKQASIVDDLFSVGDGDDEPIPADDSAGSDDMMAQIIDTLNRLGKLPLSSVRANLSRDEFNALKSRDDIVVTDYNIELVK